MALVTAQLIVINILSGFASVISSFWQPMSVVFILVTIINQLVTLEQTCHL